MYYRCIVCCRAKNITVRFPDYLVTLYDIGKGPEETRHVGHFAQMAVFFKKDLNKKETIEERSSFGICTPVSNRTELVLRRKPNSYFVLLERITYPFCEQFPDVDEYILREIKDYIINICSYYYNREKVRFEIPIRECIECLKDIVFIAENDLRFVI